MPFIKMKRTCFIGWLRLAEAGWMPKDSVIRSTENDSVDMKTLLFVIKHVNGFIRRFVPQEKTVVPFLDGNGSRKGLKCIEDVQECTIELILFPANTTHFLQSCDNYINKTFQKVVKETRDICSSSRQRTSTQWVSS